MKNQVKIFMPHQLKRNVCDIFNKSSSKVQTSTQVNDKRRASVANSTTMKSFDNSLFEQDLDKSKPSQIKKNKSKN